MRRAALLSLLVCLSPEAAHAFRDPGDGPEIRAIEDHIELGRLLQSQVDAARRALSADGRSIDNVRPDSRAVQEQQRAIAELERRRDLAYSKALHRIAAAFDLQLPQRSGVSVMPGTRGRTIEWVIVAAPRHPRMMMGTDARGRPVPLVVPAPSLDEATGITSFDGVTTVFPEVFYQRTTEVKNIIRLIAVHLAHERAHFLQYTTPGQGDRMSKGQLENAAYASQRSALHAVRLPEAVKKFELSRIEARVRSNDTRDRNANPEYYSSGAEGYYAARPDADLDSIRRQAAEIDAQVREERQRRAAGREEPSVFDAVRPGQTAQAERELERLRADDREARRLREAVEARLRAEEAERRAHPRWEALKTWASAACEYMTPGEQYNASGSNWESVRDSHARKASSRRFLLENFVVLERAELAAEIRRDGRSLSSCQAEVIDLINRARGPVNAGWLIQTIDYRRGGGTLGAILRGLVEAVDGGVAAVVNGIAAPFVAGPGTPSRTYAPRQPSPREDGGERPAREFRGVGCEEGKYGIYGCPV
ncbi:MAG: hypothetical protein HY059_09305 [Proteobacteria bacterium]|nr:hypothetical protein [Pseudomonadota bacterium]